MAQFIYEMNSKPNQNMYFVDATVLPENMNRRTSDKHFCEGPGLRVDQDKPEHTAADLVSMVTPNSVNVTGRYPSERRQLYWLTSEPISDAALLVQLNRRLLLIYPGDSAVINPTTLMRLPGSVAWPVKGGRLVEGRRIELVTWHRTSAPAPNYPVGMLAARLPMLAVQSQEQERPHLDVKYVSQLIKELSTEGCPGWHNKMVQLSAHWLGRLWSDEEILAAARAFNVSDQHGREYTWEECEAEVLKAISLARVKWNLPSIDRPALDPWQEGAAEIAKLPAIPQVAPLPEPKGFQFITMGQAMALHKRPEFLIEDILPRAMITMVVGPPGAGKSPWVQDMVAGMISDTDFMGRLGQPGLRGLYLARESEGQTITNLRNFLASRWGMHTDDHANIDARSANRLILLTSRTPSGSANPAFYLETDTELLIWTLKQAALPGGLFDGADPDFIVLDTLRAMSVGAVTDDGDMQLVQSALDRIRSAFPTTSILLIHHSPKSDPEGVSGSNRLQGMSDTHFSIAPLKSGQTADGEGGYAKRLEWGAKDADGYKYATARLIHQRSKAFAVIDNTLVTLRVKDDHATLLYGGVAEGMKQLADGNGPLDQPVTGQVYHPGVSPFEPIPGSAERPVPTYAPPLQQAGPPHMNVNIKHPLSVDPAEVAESTLCYYLSTLSPQNGGSVRMRTLLDTVNANKGTMTPDVQHQLGIGRDEAQQRTYILRRLTALKDKGKAEKLGDKVGATWRLLP